MSATDNKTMGEILITAAAECSNPEQFKAIEEWSAEDETYGSRLIDCIKKRLGDVTVSTECAGIEWRHKDEWRKRGQDFLIVVSRHSVASEYPDGPNRWAVYAYIYPKHPHFAAFDGPKMWQDATAVMPLHGGCSLLEYPMYEGVVSSVKIGADYNHLHDDSFAHYATQDDAAEVFSDAAELYQWLSIRATGVAV